MGKKTKRKKPYKQHRKISYLCSKRKCRKCYEYRYWPSSSYWNSVEYKNPPKRDHTEKYIRYNPSIKEKILKESIKAIYIILILLMVIILLGVLEILPIPIIVLNYLFMITMISHIIYTIIEIIIDLKIKNNLLERCHTVAF